MQRLIDNVSGASATQGISFCQFMTYMAGQDGK